MAYENVGSIHDVELGGFGLKIAAGTYQIFPIPPFAPRVASENPSHSTFDAYQAMTWDDWSHGLGFPKAQDAKGYDYSSGNIDTRTPHALQLSTAQTLSATPAQSVTCFQDFNSNLYAGMAVKPTNSTLWKYTVGGGTWAEEATAGYPATKITDLLASKDASGNVKLFIALSDTSDIAFMTWSDAAYATPVATAYARLFAHAGGYMWYADRTNNIAYSDDPTTAWSALIPVGSDAHAITGLCEFAGRLYIGKTNGLYYIDPGTDLTYPAITFNDEINASNGVLLKQWHGYLYAVVNGRLYQINGSHALSDITPPSYTNRWPFERIRNFKALCPARQFLYYIAEDDGKIPLAHLFAFDGIGHHRLADIETVSVGTGCSRALYFSQVTTTPYLWHATTASTGKIYYTPMNAQTENPYPAFPTTGVHYIETSTIDFDMPETDKNFRDVTVEMNEVMTGKVVHQPQTITDDATVGTVAWTIPGSGSLATSGVLAATTSHYLKGVNCGFAIPSAATVSNVWVSLGVPANLTSMAAKIFTTSVKLVKGGAISGNAIAGSLTYTGRTSAGDYQTWGGDPTLVWGVALAASDVNGATFGAVFSATGTGTLPINRYNVTVEWTLGELSGSATVEFAIDGAYNWHTLGTADSTSRYQKFTFDRADGVVVSAGSTSFTDATTLTEAYNYWVDARVDIVSGTGYGQTRRVTDFSNGVCTVDTWDTTPDTTSRYQLTWQGRNIRFRISLDTDTSTVSPVVRSFTLTHEPRPALKRGWRFRALASDQAESYTGNIRQNMNADTIAAMLMAWRDVKAPLQYKDINGTTYSVVVTDVQMSAVLNPLDRGQQGAHEFVAAVSLAQV